MTDPNPAPYKPKRPESYYLAVLLFTSALRVDNQTATATAARSLSRDLARELDQGRLDVDQNGNPVASVGSDGPGPVRLKLLVPELPIDGFDPATGKPAKVKAPPVVHVVDKENRPQYLPAPRHLHNDTATIPHVLSSGAALLSVALAAGSLTERERCAVAVAAAQMLAARKSMVPDTCRNLLALAIEDVRGISAEAGWDREIASPPDPAELARVATFRARVVEELTQAGPAFAETAEAARAAEDVVAFARAQYDAAPAVFARVFSVDTRAEIGLRV